MKLDERKVENIAIILACVGLPLVFLGIDGPVIAGSILCGAIVIARRLENNEKVNHSEQDEPSSPEGDTNVNQSEQNNPITRP